MFKKKSGKLQHLSITVAEILSSEVTVLVIGTKKRIPDGRDTKVVIFKFGLNGLKQI